MDHRLYREYGRAPRGERIYQNVSGSRRGRTSILSAYDGEKLVSPILFEGSCNSDVFNEWLEKIPKSGLDTYPPLGGKATGFISTS